VAAGLAVGLAARGAALAASEQFVVTIQGVRAGEMVVERSADTVRVDYSWRDNGRGPDMTETFRIGERRRALDYRVQGRSTFGGEIREAFERAKVDGNIAAQASLAARAVAVLEARRKAAPPEAADPNAYPDLVEAAERCKALLRRRHPA
jgi:hypothetical protein